MLFFSFNYIQYKKEEKHKKYHKRNHWINCDIRNRSEVIDEFHKGDCGGHHYWKATANKVLRAGYFWPTMFRDIYKNIASCHECQVFEGK